MSPLPTITLEILRDGPPHNQLVSPLTPYLAICDNRGATTLRLPFEHHEVLRGLAELRPRPGASADTSDPSLAEKMGAVLGAISPLGVALGGRQEGSPPLIHLRLILSASELAILPFELALAPPGFPGQSKPLLRQSVAPLSLTREVRGAPVFQNDWSRPARVLIAAAAPAGLAPVPLRQHLLALRHALDPWIPPTKSGFQSIVTVLPAASLHDIEEACARTDFTHISILAHGAEEPRGGETCYGLALFDRFGAARDFVDGIGLSAALLAGRRTRGAAGPMVVTLASCDSGHGGTVISPGASLAHDLHEAGIPWIIGSQLPLSMIGSVVMVEALYHGLFSWRDPRQLLFEVRQKLRRECPHTWDWASVVAYTSLPGDFDELVRSNRKQRAAQAINLRSHPADELLTSQGPPAVPQPDARELDRKVRASLAVLSEELRVLEETEPRDGEGPPQRVRTERAEILGLKGSAEKHMAYLHHRIGEEHLAQDALRRAHAHYGLASHLAPHSHWVQTQHLCLCAVLKQALDPERLERARWAANLDLRLDDRQQQAWAHGSLAELEVLATLLSPPDPGGEPLHVQHAQQLVKLAGPDAFAVLSTRRHFERYKIWWWPGHNLATVAEQILSVLR